MNLQTVRQLNNKQQISFCHIFSP